jgi:hypothetical protein
MRKLFFVAGLLAAPAPSATPAEVKPKTATPQEDQRSIRLKQFFTDYKCPLGNFAADFVIAADRNDLDWRLLPGISMVESGGGRDYRNNNVFGWDSCRLRFPSVRAGIHIVASKLGGSRLYKDKDVDKILKTYNPRPDYAGKVKSWMRMIGSRGFTNAMSLN